MGKVRVVVADDHSIVRTGLVSLLGAKRGFEVVAEAANGEEAVEVAMRHRPDVVVMDLMMPGKDGAEATAMLHSAAPEVKVLILTTFGTANDIAHALDNGASGAIMKSATNDELVAAILGVVAGERVVSPEIERILEEAEPVAELSQRQIQILDSITRGLSKIGASNRAEAASIALRRHLLKI